MLIKCTDLALHITYLFAQFKKVNLMENLKDKLLLNIDKGMENKLLSNDDLVQIIEQCGSYLNLMTISDYAEANKISYNGAKHFREHLELFGVKFIVDNV